jgi:hypothetical protein
MSRYQFRYRYRIDAGSDPDPTFHFDAYLDRDPNPTASFTLVRVLIFLTVYEYLRKKDKVWLNFTISSVEMDPSRSRSRSGETTERIRIHNTATNEQTSFYSVLFHAATTTGRNRDTSG